MLLVTEQKNKQITDSSAAANIFRSILSAENKVDQDKEHFWVIGLNTRNIVSYVELVSLGTLNTTLVHPREVFRMAIIKAVASVMLGHNHPSGSSEASLQDEQITRQLKAAGDILGIEVMDHIIIANKKEEYFSFRSNSFLYRK